MIKDMIELLRGELAQEVPSTLDALAQWQLDPDAPPAGVADMVSLLGRFAQAVETVGLEGLAGYLLLIGQFTESLLATAELRHAASLQTDHAAGSDAVAIDLDFDIDFDIGAETAVDPGTDPGTGLALGVTWLGQWLEEVLAYLENPAHPQIVEHMASYLSLCPQPFDIEIIVDVAERLLVAPILGDGADEVELLERATDEDVALSTEEVDPELLDALLADAPQQLQQLESAVSRWADGACTEGEMLEAQRGAHTFKGSGYIIGLPGIGRVAHRLEDVLEHALDGIRAGEPASPPMARDVMQAVYCLQQMVGHLMGEEAAPDNAKAVLQRLLDWVGWIRQGEAAGADPEPLAGTAPATAWAPGLVADTGDADSAADAKPVATKTGDAAMLRVGVTQVSRLLRRAGQSIIHSERLSKLLLDTESWLLAMERNNQVMTGRLRELDIMVNSQVVQLRGAQPGDDNFDPLELDRYDALHGMSRFIGETARDSFELVQQARASTALSTGILREESYALVEQHRELLAARMVTVKTIIPRLKRTVAQTASATGCQVVLQVTGENVAMDADVLNRLAEPLLHLLRNAVDHGIESPEDRLYMGKPEHGTIRLDFQRSGEEVVLRVTDDGRGLDLAAIEDKAVAYGLIDASGDLSEPELQRLILRPGFSTRDAVTETSGRGVGMDVVNDRINGLKGRLEIESAYGLGCCFTVVVPATSGVAHALVVKSAGESVALPREQVHSIVAAGMAQFGSNAGVVTISYEGQHYPAHVLAQWLDLEHHDVEQVLARAAQWIVVLAKGATGTVALLVDEVNESRELILQDVGRLVRRVPGVIGGALRADGRPLFLLGVTELERAAGSARRLHASATLRRRLEVERTRVLVVDDAWSVRRSMQQLLEDAGYEVATAADGFEALERLRASQPALVITDLEMPNLNGLELTRRVREVPQWATIPVVMITSRTSDKHRGEAAKAGVDVYLTKPYQDADLLLQVRSLCAKLPEAEAA
jgi:chemotaxis protein histidine kinase CheA/ActR/RegA family two-component response regulator